LDISALEYVVANSCPRSLSRQNANGFAMMYNNAMTNFTIGIAFSPTWRAYRENAA